MLYVGVSQRFLQLQAHTSLRYDMYVLPRNAEGSLV
jgi:hypothetical protein